MQRRFGSVRGIVEYTIFIAFLQLIIRLYQAFGIVGPTKDQVSEWLAAYKAGSISLPDWRDQMR